MLVGAVLFGGGCQQPCAFQILGCGFLLLALLDFAAVTSSSTEVSALHRAH
jgi:hypothetical protein